MLICEMLNGHVVRESVGASVVEEGVSLHVESNVTSHDGASISHFSKGFSLIK